MGQRITLANEGKGAGARALRPPSCLPLRLYPVMMTMYSQSELSIKLLAPHITLERGRERETAIEIR